MRIVIEVKEDRSDTTGFLRFIKTCLIDAVKGYGTIFTGSGNGSTSTQDKPEWLHLCRVCDKYHAPDKPHVH